MMQGTLVEAHEVQFSVKKYFDVRLPVGNEVLAAQVVNGVPYLFVCVDPRRGKAKYRFFVVATGEDTSGMLLNRYIGTFQLGSVYHVFSEV
jgi:hypothetical protein